MRKLLLIVLALGFVGTGIAQKQYTPKKWYNNVKETSVKAVAEELPAYATTINPTVTNPSDENSVGTSYYDLQTNGTLQNRIFAFEDGTIAATWTMGMTPSSYADRGTGYNYFDGASWGAAPTERIENVRCGWPSIAPFGENGEITCAHTGGNDGLIFSWRETKGEGEWNYFNLAGPAEQPELLWPRMITSGENHDVIHVIACAGNAVEYEDLTSALLYSRSTDGGQTWDPQNVILEGIGSDYTNGWSGDSYAWAEPVGSTIAFIASGGIKDGVVMKSEDGGDNWERLLFYESPYPFFDGNAGNIERFGAGDGSNAVAIDDEGMVHVAFGRMCYLDDTPDDDAWSYYPYSDGLVYWNETMDPIDSTLMTATIMPDWEETAIYQNGNIAAYVQAHGEDTIVGVAYSGASLTSYPQIIVTRDETTDTKIAQIFYSGLSVGFSNPTYETNYRHIWGVKTEVDGMWSEAEDYTGDVAHKFFNSTYASLAPMTVNDTYHLLYQQDLIPGNSLQPNDDPSHDPIENSMIYMTVSPLPVGIDQNNEASFEVAQNTPNPAHNTTNIIVNAENNGSINLTINNLLGQVVYTEVAQNSAASHTFRVDVSNFDSGVYFYTVEINNKSVTKKMIVK